MIMPENNQTTLLSAEQREILEEKLRKTSVENRLPCRAAFAIAQSLGISTAEVGKAANRLKIRISKCQLGCF
jgi:LAO/AO transport system kinase